MNIDAIRSVRTLVTHARCSDGLAAALIVKDALPHVEVRFVQYNTPEHKNLVPKSGVLFCDFTPWVERETALPHAMTAAGRDLARQWADAEAIVLDHHEGVADLVEVFGDRGVYASAPGVSGARLAYDHVWDVVRLNVPHAGRRRDQIVQVRAFADLAGVRDTWQTKHPSWFVACAQAAALEFYPRDMLMQDGLHNVLSRRLDVGEVILKRQAEADAETIKDAYYFTTGGVRVACFEGRSREASDIKEYLPDSHLVIAWHYFRRGDQTRLKLSCRSRDPFKALPFAQTYGGNGHSHAAGCEIEVMLPSMSPHAWIRTAVSEFVAAHPM